MSRDMDRVSEKMVGDLAAALASLRASTIAVAVSGGADSMALALLAQAWAVSRGQTVLALHVDHGLRPESGREAEQVQSWLASRQIPVEVLTWHPDPKPVTAIQQQARQARYDLLREACQRHGIQHLLLAHHLEDQVETFWFRLARHSGLDGLAAMQPMEANGGGLTLVRPLLHVPPDRLRTYLKAQGQPWLEDPSNQDRRHTRVRLRQALPAMAGRGYDAKWVGELTQHLRTLRQARVQQVEDFLVRHAQASDATFTISRTDFQAESVAIQKRILVKVLGEVGAQGYPPRGPALQRLLGKLNSEDTGKVTLHQCEIRFDAQSIIFRPEAGRR